MGRIWSFTHLSILFFASFQSISEARQQTLLDTNGSGWPATATGSILESEAFILKVNRTLAKWHVPGIAISLVDGDDIYAQGYGLASLEPPVAVTPHTLFFPASTTKSQVAAALSILIDESPGNLSWTTPLSTVLRDDFVLSDPWATEHMTFEDALSHRTGLPRHDRAYGFPSAKPRDLVRLLRHLPLTAEPRTRFQYQNIMYATVGYAIEVLTNSWLGDFLHTKLWQPLGMHETFFSLPDAQKHVEQHSQSSHLATPYRWVPEGDDNNLLASSGHYAAEEYRDLTPLGGAAAVISTVNDYALYLRAMLQKSPPISSTGYAALRQPRMLDADDFHPAGVYTGRDFYTLGWDWHSYRGRETFDHAGGLVGFGAQMTYMPGVLAKNSQRENASAGWAVAMMANTALSSNVVANILVAHLMDEKLGTPLEERHDWDGFYQSFLAKQAETRGWQEATRKLFPELDVDADDFKPLPPPVALSAYAGTFWNAGYSNMTVTVRSSSSPSSHSKSCPSYRNSQKSQARNCPDPQTDHKPSSSHLHITPSQRTWPYSVKLGHVGGDWFLGQVVVPYPKSEFEQNPSRYRHGDEGQVQDVSRVKFEVGVDGKVERMGFEGEPGLVAAVEKAGGIREDGMIWFTRVE